MKKFVILLFVAMAALSTKAQVYVGGTVSLWSNDDYDATNFQLAPEVGYNLNKKWAIGGVLSLSHNKLEVEGMKSKTNTFAFVPYARYSYYENKVVRLFIQGELGFSSSKTKGADSVSGFEIGCSPGISIKLNDNFSLLAGLGFLGFRDDFINPALNGFGLNFSSEDLTFGFQYKF